MEPLDLSNTAHALKARDEFEEKVHALPDGTSLTTQNAFCHILEVLDRRVSEAFADDTADRNARDTALLVRPGCRHNLSGPSWLRRMLRKEGLYSGLPAE